MRSQRIVLFVAMLASWSGCEGDPWEASGEAQGYGGVLHATCSASGGGAAGAPSSTLGGDVAGANDDIVAGAGPVRARFVAGTNVEQTLEPLDCGVDGVAIENAGPPRNRVNYVILGDGYDASSVNNAFLDQIASAMQSRFSAPTGEPYLRYRKFVNICALKVVSATNGIGNGPTAFSCGGDDVSRLARCNTVAAEQLLDERLPAGFEVDWHAIVINSERHWGSGGAWAMWTGAQPDAGKVALHEGGHGFHQLADEYTEDLDDCFEFDEVNTTSDPVNTHGKWTHWLGYDASVATGVQCIFQGSARCRWQLAQYRPSFNSMMNNLFAKNRTASFNAISREKIVFDIWRVTRPVDRVDPPEGNVEGPRTLRLYVIDPEVISVDWSVDGELIARNAATSYDVGASGLASGSHVISAHAYDNAGSELVRARSGLCDDSRHCWNRDAWKNSQQTVTWIVTLP